jgi:hypothetical protein
MLLQHKMKQQKSVDLIIILSNNCVHLADILLSGMGKMRDANYGLVVQAGSNACFASMWSRVQIPPSPLTIRVHIIQ